MDVYCDILAWDRGKVTYQKNGLKRGEAFNLLVLGISCERLGVDEAYDAIPLPAIVCMENTPCRSPFKWIISVCCCLKVFQNCFPQMQVNTSVVAKTEDLRRHTEIAEVVRHKRKGNLSGTF